MISLFSLNDPYRMVGILALLILLRLPLLISGVPMTLTELNWMVVGEKLSSGSSMYVGVWDHLPPLSAAIYWILDGLFGRSPWAHHLLALLLVFFQSFLFNDLLLKNKAYNQNTYVPALVYVVLMNCFFEFLTLSPPLLSLTFLLLALNNVFKRIDKKTKDEFFLNTGVFLGIAGLFYLPSILFVPAVMLSLLLFTASLLRRYLLLLYGFLLPFGMAWAYYFWLGGTFEFSQFFFGSLTEKDNPGSVEMTGMIVIGLLPALFTLLSLWKIRGARYVNYQIRFQYVMLFFVMAALSSMMLSGPDVPHKSMVLIPPLAFFIAHYFLLLRRGLLKEVVFLFFLTGVLYVNWGSFFQVSWLKNELNYQGLLTVQTEWDEIVEGRTVLIFGNNLNVYRKASLATPYLNWRLSSEFLENLDYYDNQAYIYQSFRKDLPEVILDLENRIPVFFQRLPILGSRYRDLGKGVYELH